MVNSERQRVVDGWVEHHWPELGLRGRLPSFLHAQPFREGNRRGHFLASDRARPREAVAISRLRSSPGPGMADEWKDEEERLASAPGWIGAVVGGLSPVEVDGAVGLQGMLWFQDPRGEELTGLLWVGRAGDDRAVIAYWCAAGDSGHCGLCFRNLLASLRWMPTARE